MKYRIKRLARVELKKHNLHNIYPFIKILANNVLQYNDLRITKLVLVPLEEWKRLNKNGVGVGGDTYTTIEIPSSKPRNQEGRRKRRTKSSSSSSYFSSSRKAGRWGIGRHIPAPLLPLLPSSEKGKGRGEKEGGKLKLLEMLVIDLLRKEFR